jgi:hypothetical protein
MEPERATATTTIDAAPEAVFAVLADPAAHAAIDGTGWVSGLLEVFDEPRAIAARHGRR